MEVAGGLELQSRDASVCKTEPRLTARVKEENTPPGSDGAAVAKALKARTLTYVEDACLTRLPQQLRQLCDIRRNPSRCHSVAEAL